MRIAVIGAGNVGGTLGRRWAALGHEVTFGVRAPDAGEAAVKGGGALPSNARVTSMAESVRGADVVVLTTPWAAAPQALEAIGATTGTLGDVPLIDATNPLGPGLALLWVDGRSGAEQLQSLAPSVRVVKAFNTTGFGNMQDPVYDGAATVMFVAGDDADAKSIALALSRELGFESVDAGGLTRARALEQLAVLWISMAMGGMGREIAFRLVRR